MDNLFVLSVANNHMLDANFTSTDRKICFSLFEKGKGVFEKVFSLINLFFNSQKKKQNHGAKFYGEKNKNGTS